MINSRDRSIPHNLAKMSFDQIFDLTAGVDFNIICDLNLLKTISPLPPPPPLLCTFPPLYLGQTTHLISKSARVINTSTRWKPPRYLSRAIHTAEHCNPPPRPPSPSPPPLPFHQNQAPTSFKTQPSPHRLFDSLDSLDKPKHFLLQLSDFVPFRNVFYSFRAHGLANIALLTLMATL